MNKVNVMTIIDLKVFPDKNNSENILMFRMTFEGELGFSPGDTFSACIGFSPSAATIVGVPAWSFYASGQAKYFDAQQKDVCELKEDQIIEILTKAGWEHKM